MDGRRLRRDEQALGELAVGQTVGQQRGDLPLARRELPVDARRRALATAGPAPRRGPCARPATGPGRRRAPGGSPSAPRPGRRRRAGPRPAPCAACRSPAWPGTGRAPSARRRAPPPRRRARRRRAPAAPRRGRLLRRATGARRASRRAPDRGSSPGRCRASAGCSISITTLLRNVAVSVSSSETPPAPRTARRPARRSRRAAASDDLETHADASCLLTGHDVTKAASDSAASADPALLERHADLAPPTSTPRSPPQYCDPSAATRRSAGRSPAPNAASSSQSNVVARPILSNPTRELTSCISARSAAASGECDGTSSRPLLMARVSSTASSARRAAARPSSIASSASCAGHGAAHRAGPLDEGAGLGELVADGPGVGQRSVGPLDRLVGAPADHVHLGDGPRGDGAQLAVVERRPQLLQLGDGPARGRGRRRARGAAGRRSAGRRCGRAPRRPPAPSGSRCRGPRRRSRGATRPRWPRPAARCRSAPPTGPRRRGAAPRTSAPSPGTWPRRGGRSPAPRRGGRRPGRGRRATRGRAPAPAARPRSTARGAGAARGRAAGGRWRRRRGRGRTRSGRR